MNKIGEVKKELRRREWADQIAECQSSGKTVKDWCGTQGISPNTYYRRLRAVRECVPQRSGTTGQQIVPVCVSEAVMCCESTQQPSVKQESPDQQAVIRKNGIEVEVLPGISEAMLFALIRGLNQC